MSLQAVLFDLDGVLIESRGWHEDAFLSALAEAGVHLDHEFHERFLDGLSTRQKLELLNRAQRLEDRFNGQVAERKQALTAELLLRNCRPSPELKSLLTRLRDRGLRLGVCTNAVEATLQMVLGSLEISGFFDVRLSNESVTHPKPSPEIYHLAMSRLAVSPERTLILEDSPTGYRAAVDSGARVQLITHARALFQLPWADFIDA